MRIAILSHVIWRTSPNSKEPAAKSIARLADGLVAKGLDVTLYATADSESNARLISSCDSPLSNEQGDREKALTSLHISELLDHANAYDLIHNHMGFLPLSVSNLVETPILTTIRDVPSSEIGLLYKKYDHRIFYISTRDANRSSELTYLGTVDDDGDTMVDDYIRYYEAIQNKRAREDHRPWGFYEILSDKEDHKVKRITVYPGKRLSYQRHKRRSEHWHVVDGNAVATLDGNEIPLKAGESIDIPKEGAHRVANPGKNNMVFIEIQEGDYFEEDDIERLEDDFGRS